MKRSALNLSRLCIFIPHSPSPIFAPPNHGTTLSFLPVLLLMKIVPQTTKRFFRNRAVTCIV
jgi:hypothetical protein